MPEHATGTVRVNNLAMLEALMNISANTVEIICFIVAALIILGASRRFWRARSSGLKPPLAGRFTAATLIASLGLAFPSAVSWLIAFSLDAGLFD